MGKLLLVICIALTGLSTLTRPWIGISSYYLLAILGPQYIWWWNFEGLRVSLIIAFFSFAGVGLSFFRSRYEIHFLVNHQNLWLAILWLCVAISYATGPYVSSFNSSGLTPARIFSITNTIFLFYFLASLEMNDIRKLRFLVIVFFLSTAYLIYWANAQYLSQNWFQFNMGRLMGPMGIDGGSIYRDENAFAMLFVTGLPFIYYLAWDMKSIWIRGAMWAIIPFGWHAVFLTGSRGGLVGLGIVMLYILFISKKKILTLPLLIVFILFYQWQSGEIMSQRSESIIEFQEESSAQMRISAWKGGIKMMGEFPLTGVGVGAFITALPDYYDTSPRVAHNTLIQFAAESGLGAGLSYVAVVVLFFVYSKRIRHWCRTFFQDEESRKIGLYNDAATASFSGLIVCSLFLSLNTYEIFFVLLLLNNALYQLCLKKKYQLD